MKLFLLTALTMIAFAANSVLNRVGVDAGGLAPFDFAAIRVVAGALTLVVLAAPRHGLRSLISAAGPWGTGSLVAYLVGFSLAYQTLDAGAGALILFGVVQLTMFGAAVLRSEAIPVLRWCGAAIAFAGLAYLLWPTGDTAPDVGGALFMGLAGVGWGLYTLNGARSGHDPLVVTSANFIMASGVFLSAAFFVGLPDLSQPGLWAAIVSGAVTSALGYALWYTILPRLETTIAATAQLTVPVIALAGGMMFLGELASLRFVLATIVVLGGVGLSLRK